MTVAPLPAQIRTVIADAETAALIEAHLRQLQWVRSSNAVKAAYYEGEQRVRKLGISVPPELSSLNTVVGWPGTAVDVLEERLEFQGWRDPNDAFGLGRIFADNSLDVEGPLSHVDALIYGTSFVQVGSGGDGEPATLITAESPTRMTGMWSRRLRRLESALSEDRAADGASSQRVTLYRADQTTSLRKRGGVWVIDDVDEHRMGRCPVARLVNRPRAGRMDGRSEISLAVRGYTDMAVRTLLGMEVNREFYSAPQRWVIGAAEDAFERPDGSEVTGWETVMGRTLGLDINPETGEAPTVGQFPSTSPLPYLDQVRGLAQLFAAEVAFPASYLGFTTENPASADAIKAGESRLIKRSARRQSTFSLGWLEVARLALLVRDGLLPDGFGADVRCRWGDPATPTRSAAADEAVKLVGAGVLPATSSITLDRVGLSPDEQAELKADQRRARSQSMIAELTRPPATEPASGDA